MKALITGITGQDGSYLAELLLKKGYEVHGLVRRASTFNRGRIEHLFPDKHHEKNDITLHYGDLGDSSSIGRVITIVQPDEVYHLGAQSHVRVSFDIPESTGDITGLATTRILEAIRQTDPSAKFYQASSSELFGKVAESPQRETTPFHPRSPYAVSKVYGYWMTVNYRESYGMFAVNGILFNHESPRRGENFVSKKITSSLTKIKYGQLDALHIGNLAAMRDWGHARDYVEGMWRMLQHSKPEDFVLATNESHTVREFIEEAAACLDISIAWRGDGLEEIGIDTVTGRTIVAVDPMYFRPSEVELLRGDYAKAREILGWEPTIRFKQLVSEMIESEVAEVTHARILQNA